MIQFSTGECSLVFTALILFTVVCLPLHIYLPYSTCLNTDAIVITGGGGGGGWMSIPVHVSGRSIPMLMIGVSLCVSDRSISVIVMGVFHTIVTAVSHIVVRVSSCL